MICLTASIVRIIGNEQQLTTKPSMEKNAFGLCSVTFLAFQSVQGKATYGVGYKLTLTVNQSFATLKQAAANTSSNYVSSTIFCYLQHYTLYIHSPAILSKHNISKAPTELNYIDGSVPMRDINRQRL